MIEILYFGIGLWVGGLFVHRLNDTARWERDFYKKLYRSADESRARAYTFAREQIRKRLPPGTLP